MIQQLTVVWGALAQPTRNRRINKLREKCAGLEAKIAFWTSLSAVNSGGLPQSKCEQIGEWYQELAELRVQKERLESEERERR